MVNKMSRGTISLEELLEVAKKLEISEGMDEVVFALKLLGFTLPTTEEVGSLIEPYEYVFNALEKSEGKSPA